MNWKGDHDNADAFNVRRLRFVSIASKRLSMVAKAAIFHETARGERR